MLRRRLHHHLACCLGLVMCASQPLAGGREGMEAYLAPDGRLQSELVLRDAQSGFAGVTAEVWQVAPDGTWRVTRDLEGREIAPERTGDLSPEQLAGLARVLSSQDFRSLPAELGAKAEVNARQLTLRFGEATMILNLMPGEELDRAACAAAPRSELRRFAEIVQAIMHTLREEGGGATIQCMN
jgi:hypothetical protein